MKSENCNSQIRQMAILNFLSLHLKYYHNLIAHLISLSQIHSMRDDCSTCCRCYFYGIIGRPVINHQNLVNILSNF